MAKYSGNFEMGDLARERRKKTFSISNFTQLLRPEGSRDAKRKEVEKFILEDKIMHAETANEIQTSKDMFKLGAERAMLLAKLAEKHNIDIATQVLIFNTLLCGKIAYGVHGTMFVPILESMGATKEVEEILRKARKYEVIGAYAQTELAHGSNLRGLQTTAVYDPSRDEFVLNTPKLTSIKFWPGNLGMCATHAVVMAPLIVDGKSCGLQPFLVQLRSLADHTPLPGINAGSIGPMVGFHSNDNGFLRLHNVRIPRSHMLSKFAEVTRDGHFRQISTDRVTYSTMLFTRFVMASSSVYQLQRTAVIATRYSAVRRQGNSPDGGELQILDYPTQLHKLLPSIALGYALQFTVLHVDATIEKLKTLLHENTFKSLPEIHAITCGLKAFSTDEGVRYIELLRKACGGHGQLLSSGIADSYITVMAASIVEGENTVLYRQLARFLMKQLNTANAERCDSTNYLSLATDQRIRRHTQCDGSPLSLLQAFRLRTARMVQSAGVYAQRHISNGSGPERASLLASVPLVRAAKAHMELYVFECFFKAWTSGTTLPTCCNLVLQQLLQMYAVYTLLADSGSFLETETLSRSDVEKLREFELRLLQDLRPNAVGLVEAFDIPDEVLGSTIGRSDGDVYNALYQKALQADMNNMAVQPLYEKYIRPLIQGKLSKL